MNDLLDFVLDAHGGVKRWSGVSTLAGGRRGDTQLAEIAIPESEQGGWRVEEEFINAVRGEEPVTRTTFADGVRWRPVMPSTPDPRAQADAHQRDVAARS